MIKLATFRSRLIFYILLVSIFLSLSLGLSFWHTRNILLGEADQQLQRTSRLLDSYLVAERLELKRYAGIVRDNLRIQEYMYVVTEIGAENAPLDKLYQQQFGWLPIDNYSLIDTKRRSISGNPASSIISMTTLSIEPHSVRIQYIHTPQGFELVANAPVHYLDKLIGHIIVSRSYDTDKLREIENISKGRIFITNKNIVALSTIPSMITHPLTDDMSSLSFMNDTFMLNRLAVDDALSKDIDFYFGVSEHRLLDNIEQFSKLILFIVSFGLIGVLSLGILFLRDFDKPIKKLLSMTSKVAKGQLPVVSKITPRNEIDSLINHFSDMIHSLREKQVLISKAQKELETLTITDSLTELYNRRHLVEVFPKLQAQAQRDRSPLAAIIIDIDHFKIINDENGHLAGDQCLVEFSALLRSHSRTNDYLFRLGGEEFLILTLGETTKGVHAVAEKIRKATEQTPIHYRSSHIDMTISCGVCVEYPAGDKEQSLNRLLLHSDNALYLAKQTGRNKVVVHLHEDLNEPKIKQH